MNRLWQVAIGLGIFVGVFGGSLHAQENRVEQEASSTGLEVGEKAPDFSLQDQNGETRSLKARLKQGNVALVFYRSASW